MGRTVVLAGALGTKGEEFGYVAEAIRRAGAEVRAIRAQVESFKSLKLG